MLFLYKKYISFRYTLYEIFEKKKIIVQVKLEDNTKNGKIQPQDFRFNPKGLV